jgi:hypothetical protein
MKDWKDPERKRKEQEIKARLRAGEVIPEMGLAEDDPDFTPEEIRQINERNRLAQIKKIESKITPQQREAVRDPAKFYSTPVESLDLDLEPNRNMLKKRYYEEAGGDKDRKKLGQSIRDIRDEFNPEYSWKDLKNKYGSRNVLEAAIEEGATSSDVANEYLKREARAEDVKRMMEKEQSFPYKYFNKLRAILE